MCRFFNFFFPHTRTIKKMYFCREFLRNGCSKTKFIGTTKRYARSCNRKRRKFLDYNARECFGSRYSVGCILHLHYKVFLRPPIEECGISVLRFFYRLRSSLARTMRSSCYDLVENSFGNFCGWSIHCVHHLWILFFIQRWFWALFGISYQESKNEGGSFNFVSGNNTSSCLGCMCDNFSNDYM